MVVGNGGDSRYSTFSELWSKATLQTQFANELLTATVAAETREESPRKGALCTDFAFSESKHHTSAEGARILGCSTITPSANRVQVLRVFKHLHHSMML
jgi:hypothetical protein